MPATPWLTGGTATLSTVSPVFKTFRGPVGHGAFPPDELLQVVNLATSTTAEHDCVASQSTPMKP